MARRVLPLALAGALVLVAPAAADPTARGGDAVGTVRGGSVVLRDHAIERRWNVDSAGHVRGVSLRDVRTGREWAAAGPDFSLTLDEAPTSSVSVWTLRSVGARRAGAHAVTVRFT